MTTLRFLDDCLAEACRMRAAHMYICEVRGMPARFRPLAKARAEAWAAALGRPECRVSEWVTWRDLEQQSREEWEASK